MFYKFINSWNFIFIQTIIITKKLDHMKKINIAIKKKILFINFKILPSL